MMGGNLLINEVKERNVKNLKFLRMCRRLYPFCTISLFSFFLFSIMFLFCFSIALLVQYMGLSLLSFFFLATNFFTYIFKLKQQRNGEIEYIFNNNYCFVHILLEAKKTYERNLTCVVCLELRHN
jgi:hypothetical protein